MLPLLLLIYCYNFDVQVDGEEQTSPTKSVTNPRQKMGGSDEEEESPQGVPNDSNVARQPEVLPL